MRYFPENFKPEDKDNFKKLAYDRVKCYMRRDVYEHVLTHSESNYFSLDSFNAHGIDILEIKRMLGEVVKELESCGWKCTISYGGSGLFIYSGEKPANCWE